MSDTKPNDGWNPSEATPDKDGTPDTAIVPYVEALREAGVHTYQSCAGHVTTQDGEDYQWNGGLWFNDPRFDPREAADSGVFDSVARLYGREEVPVWEVKFPGLSESEESLERSMAALFDNIGVDMPTPSATDTDKENQENRGEN